MLPHLRSASRSRWRLIRSRSSVYVQQWNFDLQRQLPAGFFADIAYAGSKGVHLQITLRCSQSDTRHLYRPSPPAGRERRDTRHHSDNPNLSPASGRGLGFHRQQPSPWVSLIGPSLSILAYNFQDTGVGDSNYQSLQVSVTRRFQGGGTMLVAYTNSKLLSNTDTLTTWLEDSGVGQIQDWNNLRASVRSPRKTFRSA